MTNFFLVQYTECYQECLRKFLTIWVSGINKNYTMLHSKLSKKIYISWCNLNIDDSFGIYLKGGGMFLLTRYIGAIIIYEGLRVVKLTCHLEPQLNLRKGS